ncbi:PDZ domain-containing protein [Paenibacillus sp. SYP-B3998]|uniref:PDZ domain-containing protein n=1 Tax=Paenibacillus sp. SYP-B3998 TaxID=2678564 RepID=A0A6G3ZW46_9BACL|nr:S41 family peptidase [Paenibacillus sp. SYP-B3998]NEW06433.1 PDZ domain-containing protein [Paenibacillus sp. SYP-B3998]
MKQQPRMRIMKVTLALASALMTILPVSAMAQEDLQTKQVRELIGKLHVSGVTEEALANQSIQQMVEGLKDPYTVYFSKEEYGQFSSSLENNYVGMGARIGLDDKGVYITEVFAGSAAETAGLQTDDYIRAVDGVAVQNNSTESARSKIVGLEGTKTKVTVLRGDKELTVELTRKAVNIPEVYSKNFTNGVGYIQITDFSSDADEDFDQQLKSLNAKGLKALIVDVRNNPGGLVDTAQNITKHFVKEGVLIHTRDRNGEDDPVTFKGGTDLSLPVYILANENSASASEVLSGALQDYHAAQVIGVQTYGKGSVQQLYKLDGGSALKVTVEEYLTPNKRKVNKVGITPDVKVDGSAAQLITALQLAGISDVNVEISKHKITYNGVEMNSPLGTFHENGQLFANTRALAALVGANISWNDANRTVDITDAKGTHAIPVEADKLIIDNGTSYVNASVFERFFPQLKVNDQGETVSIHAVKGN